MDEIGLSMCNVSQYKAKNKYSTEPFLTTNKGSL